MPKRRKGVPPHQWTSEKTMTLLVLAFCATTILVYDLLVVLTYRDINATVSNTLYQASKRAPIIAFLFGVLMGHWFWPITHFKQSADNNSEIEQTKERANEHKKTCYDKG